MKKARDPKTRPKVARKEADQGSGVYDFVQSPEWQKVLENARIEREKNLSARRQKGEESQSPKPGGQSGGHTTARQRSPGGAKTWSVRLDEARQQREAVLARRAGESEERPRGAGDGGGDRDSGNRAAGIIGGTFKSQARKDRAAEPGQKSHHQLRPEPKLTQDTRAHGDKSVERVPLPGGTPQNAKSDRQRSGLRTRLSTEEAANRLRHKLFQRSPKTRRRLRIGLGSVAIGCAIGVIASSSVYFVHSKWGLPGARDSAVLATADTEIANLTPSQGESVMQTTVQQTSVSDAAAAQTVLTSDVSDTPSGSVSSNGNVAETENSYDIASLTPALTDLAGESEAAEPVVMRTAPKVRSYIPALEQPPLPAGVSGYLPRQEPNPSFLPYENTPEFFDTAIALFDEAATKINPDDLSANAIMSPPRPSDLSDGAEAADPNSFASLTPTYSDVTGGAEVVEPTIPRVAPFVLSYIPAPEQQPLPARVSGYLPRQETNPSFLPYDETPEFFAAAVALSDVAVTTRDAIEFSAEAITSPPRPPDVSYQPVSLTTPASLTPVEHRGSLPEQVQGYQPEPRGLTAIAANPDLSLPEAVAVLGPGDQPEGPGPTDPTANGLRTASLGPEFQPEDTAPLSDEIEPRETSALSRGAEFRLFAPSSLSANAVDSVVADLTATGHELSGTARVGFGISQTNVRYYHKQDAAKARALAKDAGALLRDFTGAKSKTQIGIVELWLAGKSSGVPTVKRKAKRTSRQASANNQVNRLRSQVLKKLKTATNQ